MGAGSKVDSIDLFPELTEGSGNEVHTAAELEFTNGFNTEGSSIPQYKDAKEKFERLYIEALLREAKGNVSQAARLAGKARTEIYTLLKKHRINSDTFK